MTAGLMINQFRSQELHQDTICQFITEVSKFHSESHVMASLETEVDITSLGREISFLYSHLLTFKLESSLYGRAVENVGFNSVELGLTQLQRVLSGRVHQKKSA